MGNGLKVVSKCYTAHLTGETLGTATIENQTADGQQVIEIPDQESALYSSLKMDVRRGLAKRVLGARWSPSTTSNPEVVGFANNPK